MQKIVQLFCIAIKASFLNWGKCESVQSASAINST